MTLQKIGLLSLSVILWSSCHSKVIDRCTAYIRTTDSGLKTTLIYDRRSDFNFNDTVEWCTKLKGYLPIVNTQEDLDLLTNIVANSDYSNSEGLWMGRQPIALTKICSKKWLDGTPVDFVFNVSTLRTSYRYLASENTQTGDDVCTDCEHDTCCAMYMPRYHREVGTVSFTSCESVFQRICVIPGDYMSRTADPYNETECAHIQGPIDAGTITAPTTTERYYYDRYEDEKLKEIVKQASNVASYSLRNLVVNSFYLAIVLMIIGYKFYRFHSWRSKARGSTITMNDLL